MALPRGDMFLSGEAGVGAHKIKKENKGARFLNEAENIPQGCISAPLVRSYSDTYYSKNPISCSY